MNDAAPPPPRWIARLVAGLALGALTFVAFGLWASFDELLPALATFPPWLALPVLALSLLNYGLRWVRWEIYLRRVGTVLPPALSVGVFLSGLAMSVTPGKLGELLKTALLHQAQGVPVSRSFPVVVTERLSDLVGVLVLAAAGVAALHGDPRVLAAGAVLTLALFALLATRPGTRLTFRAAGVLLRKKVSPELAGEAAEAQRRLLAPGTVLAGLVLATLAWFAEAAGSWLVVIGMGGDLTLGSATSIYAVGTLVGALSFLPGGLLATEATLTTLLAQGAFAALSVGAAAGTDPAGAAAVAATLIVRAATLWFAVILGVGGLLWVGARLRARSSGN